MKEESGSVTLLMPDGSEYPQKETDKKLEEIIGLTKNQFMQVAMIAQGEFMELLRARSDDKKVIFRKLFHTELYEKIVAELGNRRKFVRYARQKCLMWWCRKSIRKRKDYWNYEIKS